MDLDADLIEELDDHLDDDRGPRLEFQPGPSVHCSCAILGSNQ
ncbi:hypothetical protein [uncultured Kocuria sp.]|nr:hypothetical protein [uncultured Kocuria sp.]